MAKQRLRHNEKDYPVKSINCHFLDSGSFTMWTKARDYAQQHNCGEWEFYDTEEFWTYMANYVEFVKEYSLGIDLCANIDVLPFKLKRGTPPSGMDSYSLSYRNLKWLEKQGLNPVPVVHYGEPSLTINKWLRVYVEEGYQLIALGGLVGSITKDACDEWIDSCFKFVTVDGHPQVDFHGFGITSHRHFLRYPWYSVDSTSWTKKGGFGSVIVPRYRKTKEGKRIHVFVKEDLERLPRGGEDWTKDCVPFSFFMSSDHRLAKKAAKLEFGEGTLSNPGSAVAHYDHAPPAVQKEIRRWHKLMKVPLGTHEGYHDGTLSSHDYRRILNLRTYECVRHKILHGTPWKSERPAGLGLFSYDPPKFPKKKKRRERLHPETEHPIIFYSGCASVMSQAEVVLGEATNLMLTYHDFSKKNNPDARFRRILEARGPVSYTHLTLPTKA